MKKRTMMKRALSAGLVLAMTTALVGCGGKSYKESNGGGEESGDQITLTFWSHQEEAWDKSYQEIADAFMAENPDIKINIETFPYDDYESKVQTSLISKEGGADIYELWGGWGLDYASTGALAQIPEEMQSEVEEDAYPSTYGALMYDGKLYGMPQEFNIECGGLLVNTTLLEENNFEVAKTLDELIDQAKKATVIEDDIYMVKGFDPLNWDGTMYLFTSMILSQGGQYLNEDGTVDFNTPEAKKAFEELVGLYGTTTDLLGLSGGDDLEGYQQLYAGGALYVPRGPWAVSDGEASFDLKYGEDFDYVEMPWYGSEKGFAAETGWSIGVAASSEEQEAAFKFLEYFFQDDVILSHNVACGQIPAKKSVAQSDEYKEKVPYSEPLLGILDDAQFIGYFNTDSFKEIVNDVYMNYVTTDTYADVDAAMADLTDRVNDIVIQQ